MGTSTNKSFEAVSFRVAITWGFLEYLKFGHMHIRKVCKEFFYIKIFGTVMQEYNDILGLNIAHFLL
jgi:hypothetical protein